MSSKIKNWSSSCIKCCHHTTHYSRSQYNQLTPQLQYRNGLSWQKNICMIGKQTAHHRHTSPTGLSPVQEQQFQLYSLIYTPPLPDKFPLTFQHFTLSVLELKYNNSACYFASITKQFTAFYSREPQKTAAI